MAQRVETNHIQDSDDEIYCHKNRMVLEVGEFTQEFVDKQCWHCPYLEGGNQGMGIECKFYDGSNDYLDQNTSAWALKAMMDELEKFEKSKEVSNANP